VLTVICCPGCDGPAEITDQFMLASSHGPVEHVALQCTSGHHFRMPSDLLPPQAQEHLRVQRPLVRLIPALAKRGTGG
jgi:hypothetical protein